MAKRMLPANWFDLIPHTKAENALQFMEEVKEAILKEIRS